MSCSEKISYEIYYMLDNNQNTNLKHYDYDKAKTSLPL